MAAPQSAGHYFSDDELKKIAEGGLTEEEVSSLTDDEIRRIGQIHQEEQSPLAGKPTIQQHERAKTVADTPVLRKPQRTIPGPPVEEPFTIEGMVKSAGKALQGDRPEPEQDAENFKTPAWEQLVMRAQNQPETLTSGEHLRVQQDALIGAHQPMSVYAGPKPASPEENAAITHIATSALQEGVTSLAEFVAHPWKQFAERPGEFGMNLLTAGVELGVRLPAMRGLKGVTISDAAGVDRRVAPEVRKAFGREFNERLANEIETLRQNEKNMTAKEYREASAAIDEKVRTQLRGEYADIPSVPDEVAGVPRGAGEIDPESELVAKLSEQRKRRPPLPRLGEETPEDLARAATATRETEARQAIVTATPTEVRAVNEVLETKLDDIASLKELNREMGGDAATTAKLREIESQITGTQDTIAETRAGSSSTNRFEAGDVVKHKNGQTYTVDSVEILPGGKSKVTVVDDADNRHVFHPAWLEPTDEAMHVPPSVKVPKTAAEWDEFHGSIPDTAPSPEEMANIAQNKAVPGAEYVPPAKEYKFERLDTSAPVSGEFYHGTKADISDASQLDPGQFGDVGALKGMGLYLTDSPKVAQGYSVTKGTGKFGKVLPVRVEGANLVDLENVATPQVKAVFDSLGKSIPEYSPLSSDATGNALIGNLKEAMRDSEFTTGEAVEVYQELGVAFKNAGIDGFRYNGGGRVGKQAHNALVLFEDFGAGKKLREVAKASEISASTDAATAKIKLTDALSVAPLGGVLLAGIAQDDKEDPTPKQGSPLALKSALWAVPAGIFAYGAARYFKSPAFRTAVKRFVQLDKTGEASLERVFEEALSPLFPDIPANGLQSKVPALGTAAGAAAGAAVGSGLGQDETNANGALFGAVTGAMMGAHAGTTFAKQFRTPLTYRQLYKMYFTEAAGMSESAVNAKYMTRASLEGRIREIKDVATKLNSFDDATNGVIQSWMSGNTNIAQVPAKARESAQAARQLFDGLSMDLLKSGLVKDQVLRDTIKTNIGTYVPRLLLRYELDDPREIVEGWLRSQGKGWGYISSKNYLKAKKNIPPHVLTRLGEITDNPGYLLAKRGVITAADIEQARYHRFLLSSPENALPARLVRQQKRVTKAQKAIIAGGGQVAGPPQVRFYRGEGGMEAAEWQGRTYWKMPDNPRYGLVKNQFIEQAVASDIISTHETTSGLQKVFDAPLSVFKYFKAVMNPASQFRNKVANAIFADIEAGIPTWRMDKWTTGAIDLNSQGKWYKQARRDGVFGGEFTTAEIGNLLLPEIQNASSTMEYIGNALVKNANKGSEFFTKWHQWSEAWARMTVYRHAVETIGMDGPAAAKFARRTIPDYQDVPRWIKVVRRSPFGAPFVSFSYKALPRSLEAAVAFGDPKKMMRFWKYPLGMAALNEYSAQAHGLLGKDEADKTDLFGTLRRTFLRTITAGTHTPDSYDTFRKYLPGHVGGMQIAIPWRDQYDRQQYLDGTFFLPWGDAGEMGKGEFAKGLGAGWFPRQLEPSNPWYQLANAASTGKDSFTGRDIAPAGSVGIEHTMAWARFLMRAWGPSLLNPAGYSAEALSKSFSGKFEEDPNVKSRATAFGSEVMGARARPVDPRMAYRFKYFDLKKDLDSNMSELRRLIPSLMKEEDLTKDQVKKILATNPGKAASRALRRRLEMVEKFKKDFPADELPPTPEKLIRAIQEQYKK